MAKVRDLIKGSLRLIQVLASNETATADDQADALVVLNGMLGSWSTENLLIVASARETFPLVDGQQTYTMGASGNFNTIRPQSVDVAVLQITNDQVYEVPIEIIGLQEWSAISVKETRSSIPTKLYVEYTYPLAKLNFWPIPTGGANVVLNSTQPFSELTSANDDLTVPPGYFDALKYNLAMRLAPEYGKPIDPALGELAAETKENIKRQNIKDNLMQSDAPMALMRKRFSILTGD